MLKYRWHYNLCKVSCISFANSEVSVGNIFPPKLKVQTNVLHKISKANIFNQIYLISFSLSISLDQKPLGFLLLSNVGQHTQYGEWKYLLALEKWRS